jgi:hypothetical protein
MSFNEIWKFFLLYKNIFIFLVFPTLFNLGANKEDLLHATHFIISLSHFG